MGDYVERIRARWAGVLVDPSDRDRDWTPAGAPSSVAWWDASGETVEARWWDEDGRSRALDAPADIATLLDTLDRERAETARLRAALTEREESAAMACEQPCGTCCGCLYANERATMEGR